VQSVDVKISRKNLRGYKLIDVRERIAARGESDDEPDEPPAAAMAVAE
jgi:hypothetical protein